jgi:Flp pilus assembly protein TadG
MALKDFISNRSGNVIPLFALAIIPVFGLIGVAIDYSRANAARSHLQAALDATALMLSKDAIKLSSTALQQRALEYFNANFQDATAYGVNVTSVLTNPAKGNYTVAVSGTGKVNTTFASLLGTNVLDIAANSEVSWGFKRIELAMALDNTGSMADKNKMVELKKAAKGLIDTLAKAAQKKDDVRIAIIPFATDVNVGPGNSGATWLNWSGSTWKDLSGNCENASGAEAPAYTSKTDCEAAGKVWVAVKKKNWNGCVADRDQDYDVTDDAPSSKATKFPPHQAANCPVSLLPLSDVTTNWSSADLNSFSPTSVLGQKIDSMQPAGNTNVTIGAVWGWHALTGNDPLPEGSAPAPDLDKVLILLTDGTNTQNRFTSNAANIDARTKKVCDNIKAANIKVYTVRVIDGNAGLLQGCASKADMYYDVQNASALNAVFNTIATNLANLRVSK